MKTIKQYRRGLIEDYGCVPCEALEKQVSKQRKLRHEINESLKRTKRELNRWNANS